MKHGVKTQSDFFLLIFILFVLNHLHKNKNNYIGSPRICLKTKYQVASDEYLSLSVRTALTPTQPETKRGLTKPCENFPGPKVIKLFSCSTELLNSSKF